MSRRLMDDSDEVADYRPYINTCTPLDIINGQYIPTPLGTQILSGGLGGITAVVAEANKFKSTVIDGGLINGAARFPDAEVHIYDSELSKDPARLANFSSMYLDDPEKREAHLAELRSRIAIYDPSTARGESLDTWFDFMKEVRDKKVRDAKNWEVETEVLNRRTGKPFRMLLPTFIGIDSWTEAMVGQLNLKNEEIDADTEMSKQRTIFMEEAWKKSQLMRQLPKIAANGGFYIGITGHLGKKISMDGKPMKKDLVHMGQDETVKAMGNKFNFLMNTIIKISNAYALADKSDKNASEYPSKISQVSGSELLELSLITTRCKNAPAGQQTSLTAAQRFGVMPGLSYYNYLRNSKYYGLGSPNKVRNPLLGEMDIGRTKIFDASRKYEVERALELTYQLYMIQTTWSLINQTLDFTIPIDVFAEGLNKSSYAMSDILNSRGWWTYTEAKGGDFDRPLLTLPDIIMILNGSYTPKLFAVTK